ncbi:MAG: TIGR04076 family protein [Candidatus Korarchaeum sp.]|nr:TIGR04076 family protein [Candidatus Korarchaeum sp.]MDW8034975.1 TIGR04076 family protein [Candidatus Korarchaeum sp.]
MHEVLVVVEEVRGRCAAGYKPGDGFLMRGFYIERMQEARICLHALSSMLTFVSPMLKGVPAEALGIGSGSSAYTQCPDPGAPLTCGGTVVFKLMRREFNFNPRLGSG